MNKIIRIATRKSPLALWQAEYVKAKLLAIAPDLQIKLLEFVTQGDKTLDTNLNKIGGKGLFVKELEQAILRGEADLAVHSMKDMTMQLPEHLMIAACCERQDPRDALVANTYQSLAELPKGAVIGTSSLRRQSQLLAYRPDLRINVLRGNVGTRLAKLDAGEFDAIILAAAGLQRLGLAQRIKQYLDVTWCLPAVGQGIIGIECRKQDLQLQTLLAALNDPLTFLCLTAERSMNQALGGGCHVPVAGYAQVEGDELLLEGRVAKVDGSLLLQARARGTLSQAQELGILVANDLMQQGAGQILCSHVN